MKKILLTLFLAVMATVGLYAQQISVVSSDGSTTLYKTLKDAIEGASDGSVIYLPGGGFSIGDSVKITRRVNIIGVGHKVINDNVDGNTVISGNLFFNEGSSGSALMGCYITGNVYVGNDGVGVDHILIRYNNMNSVQVGNSDCFRTVVNQNYIRSTSGFGGSNAEITNNILHSMNNIVNGLVSHNVILGAYTYKYGSVYMAGSYSEVAGIGADTSTIKFNILNPNVPYSTSQGYGGYTCVHGENNQCVSNLTLNNNGFGELCIVLENVGWNDIFEDFNNGAISANSNFHFKENYRQYENQVGVYADGVDFDQQLAPVPYIVASQVDEQTDASGKLNIKIRVKAGE